MCPTAQWPLGARRPSGTVTRSQPEAVVDALFAETLEQAERVVAAVPRERLGSPTPCPDWDVQALLGHLLAVVRRAERVAQGRPASSVPDVVAVDPRIGAAAQSAAAPRRARLTTAPPDDVRALWGLLPGPAVLSGCVLEPVAHTHDLVVSADQRQLLGSAARRGGAPRGRAARLARGREVAPIAPRCGSARPPRS
jgi:uncharacterized protein (TIGR03086 family)